MRLEKATSPATGTHCAHELQTATEAPVAAGTRLQGVVLFNAGLACGEARGDKLPHHFRKGRIIEPSLQGGALHIRQSIPAGLDGELNNFIQLADAGSSATGQPVDRSIGVGLRLRCRLRSGANQLEIDLHTAVIYTLIDPPLTPHHAGRAELLRELSPHFAHSFHIEPAVIHEARPVLRMSSSGGHGAIRTGRAEQTDETTPVGILRLISRKPAELAEISQGTRERKRESEDHGIQPALRVSHLGEIPAEDCPVKI